MAKKDPRLKELAERLKILEIDEAEPYADIFLSSRILMNGLKWKILQKSILTLSNAI